MTDQSVGWGSNSQWGTKFRRDYHFPGEFHFNVDSRLKPGQWRELTREEVAKLKAAATASSRPPGRKSERR